MSRGHVLESLSAYLDEQVSGVERARIDAHLATCEQCRRYLDDLQRTVGLVRELEPVKAPEGLQAVVRGRLQRVPASRLRGLPRVQLSWRVAAATAAVALIGIFAANLLREIQGNAPAGRHAAPAGGLAAPGADERSRNVPKGAVPPMTSMAAPQVTIPELRQVIRTAELSLEVDDFDSAVKRLVSIVEGAGGFVADSSYTQTGTTPQGAFTLRVPARRFAGVLDQVEALGRVGQRRISGQDVTEEYVDLQARARNLERHEQRLLSFMDRATKVSDLLVLEQELARVRGEIEQLTGRMRLLSQHVELATIEVALRQKTNKTGGFWDFGATGRHIAAAFLATVRQILVATERLAVVISALTPVAVLLGFGWLLLRRLRARAV